MGVPEQREQREVGRCQRQNRLCHVGGIHGHVLSAQSGSVGRTGAAQYPKSTSARDDAPLRAKPRPNVSRKSFVPLRWRTKSPRNLAKLGRGSGLIDPYQRDYGEGVVTEKRTSPKRKGRPVRAALPGV